jgi:hypothetical protein
MTGRSIPAAGMAPKFSARWLLPAVALATVLPRLIFIWAAPALQGDGATYAIVALNILHNGCVSMSDPALGACVPHWGGNQLPGYPAFIALAWFLTGEWSPAPLIAQTLAYGGAAAYLVGAVIRGGGGMRGALMVGAVLVLSPTLVAWPRVLLTETLAAAGALWVLAVILRSIADGKLRMVELGLVFAVGIFVRYDFALLAVPIAIAGFYLHTPSQALRRGAVVALIAAIPFGAWAGRNMAVGIAPVQPFGMTTSGDPAPSGTLDWMGTWITGPYDLPISIWPALTGDYQSIVPPDRAFASAAERETAIGLVADLIRSGHGPVPQNIDDAFANLAKAKRRADPLWQRLGLPLRRAGEMWLSPFPSLGWPGEIGTGRSTVLAAVKNGDFATVAAFARDNAGPAAAKALVAGWRYLVLMGIAALIILNVLGRRRDGVMLWLPVAFSVFGTAAFASFYLVEARYLVPAFAWLEVSLVLVLFRSAATNADPDHRHYDQAFFDYATRGSELSAQIISAKLFQLLPIRSVVDFGCAEGVWLSAWKSSGAEEIQGVDGAWVDPERLKIPKANFFSTDLTRPVDLDGRQFDLVQSLEVAEHLPASAAPGFVESLVRHGKIILFSAAPPGQGGENHVNEREFSYWQGLFWAHQYRLFDAIRPWANSMTDIQFWYRYNTFLYVHESSVPALSSTIRATEIGSGQRIHDVAPVHFRVQKFFVRLLPYAARNWLARLKARMPLFAPRGQLYRTPRQE